MVRRLCQRLPLLGRSDKADSGWVDVVAKTRAALEAEGVLMSNEETLALVEEERKEYIGSVVTYEQIALEFMGFPSLELYHAYKQLRAALSIARAAQLRSSLPGRPLAPLMSRENGQPNWAMKLAITRWKWTPV